MLVRLFGCYEGSFDKIMLAKFLKDAARGGRVEMLPANLAAGARQLVLSVDEVTRKMSALHVEVIVGHRRIVANARGEGATVDSRDIVRGTTSGRRLKHRHKGVVIELLSAGADVNKMRDARFHLWDYGFFLCADKIPLCAVIESNDEKMVKILLGAEETPSESPMVGLPLHSAAS